MSKIKKGFKTILSSLLIILGLVLVALVILSIRYATLNQTNGSIVTSGQERTYLLYVPDSYDPETPTPLIIAIHGFAEWPAHLMNMSGWNDLADEYGFIVVYPSGIGFPKRWRTDGSNMDDVEFISDLIDGMENEFNIDPNRIYANGLSNGGGMSFLLGCILSDRIAAIGGVAGAYSYPLDDCDPSRFVPMIAFHGTRDPIVDYLGQPGREGGFPLPNIPEWMAALAVKHNCVADSTEILADGIVTGVHYSICADDADVVLYTIEGGGHTWPGGEPMAEWLTGTTFQGIDATQMMWDFFTRFSLTD